jgi:hypothetical protein
VQGNQGRAKWWGVLSHLLAAAAAAVVAIGVTVAIDDNGPNPPSGTPHHRVTVTLGGPGHGKVTLSPADQAQLHAQAAEDAAGQTAEAESNLHESAPPAPAALADARKVAPPGSPAIPQSTTFAAPSTTGCQSQFVRNFSSRPAGARVDLGVIHWTGSSPFSRKAIVRWFDTPAAQASSNYITDQDGSCSYVVPETKKAWTQAAANPWAVSVEVVNAGVQPLFQTPAARAAVVRLMRGWHKRWGIPYVHGAVNSNCVPTRPGFLAHRDLGVCGGGHPDVGTFDLDGLIREAAQGSAAKPVTSVDRVTCRKLNWWRTHGRHHGRAEKNAVRRRDALARRHVVCTARGPVRR